MDYLNLSSEALLTFDQGEYQEAIALYEQCVEINPEEVVNYWYLGLAYLLTGDEEEAQNLWLSLLWQGTPEQTELWTEELTNFLLEHIQQKLEAQEFVTAKKIYNVLQELKESNYELENIFSKQAEVLLQQSQNNSDYQQAITLVSQALELDNNNPKIWYHFSILCYHHGEYELAYNGINSALVISPNDPDYYYLLGLIDEKLNKLTEAQTAYQEAIKLNPKHHNALINLGNVYKDLNQLEIAADYYRQAIQINPNHYGPYLNLLLMLKRIGDDQQMIAVGHQAYTLFPDNILLKIKYLLFLPLFYQDSDQVEYYYQKYTAGLEQLAQEIKLETAAEKIAALEAVGDHINFSLSYQCKNHVKLHQKYGEIVYRVMLANFPEWMRTKTLDNSLPKRKIKLGYVSSLMWSHVGGQLMLGWLEKHDKEQLEIYSYYVDTKNDEITQRYQLNSDFFYHIPANLKLLANQIAEDNLDVIIFIDIGLMPLMTQIASLRLAPIQCATWGHPETTGLPNIDYFISNELMEPEDAQEHYSETLIKLPNLGVCHPGFVIPSPHKQPSDFHPTLDANSIIYIANQNLIKYLPRYDFIYPEIARQVPQAKFIFVERPNTYIAQLFKQRLGKSFAEFNLNIDNHCLFFPLLNNDDYWNMYLIAHVFLDSINWSGCYTSMQAITCHLPVVTCIGEFMRSNQSVGLLTRINVTETIAISEAEYIEIACRLGKDQPWRDTIKAKMQANYQRMFNDQDCVTALDNFLLSQVKK